VNDAANREENRDVAAVVITGVLVAISLALGFGVSIFKARAEQSFKELGVALPNITILALEPLTQVIALGVLVGCAAIIAIKGLRVIGLSAWVIALFLYLGFWALSLGYPMIRMMDNLEAQSSQSTSP
jgi:hypothetical protein